MKSRKLIAMLLVLVMVFSVCGVQAFADNEDVDISRFSDGTGYLLFGDSITRGYAATDNWDEIYSMDNTKNPNCRNVTGSYPKLVAEAIGCNCPDNILDTTAEYWPICQDAISTAYVLDLLGVDDGFYDEEYLYAYSSMKTRYETALYYVGDEESFTPDNERYGSVGKAMSVRELVANSSLISIAVGMGDVWNRARSLAADGVDLSNTEALIGALKDLVVRMYEGYSYWEKNYPLILDYFKANMRDDAAVVLIGTTNPVFNMNISAEYLYPVGSALSAITAMMNAHYKQWAEEYGFIYVDISNVETGSTEGEVGLMEFISAPSHDQGRATHPTAEGYRQISRLIIAALKEHEAGQKVVTTDIKVDLGRIKSVSKVCVNGVAVRDYTLNNDGLLTIRCNTPFATSLTVTSVGADGKVAVTTYQLAFDKDSGYAAYRIYTTNDIGGVVKSAAKNVTSAISTITKTLSNVFSSLIKK